MQRNCRYWGCSTRAQRDGHKVKAPSIAVVWGLRDVETMSRRLLSKPPVVVTELLQQSTTTSYRTNQRNEGQMVQHLTSLATHSSIQVYVLAL